MSTRHTHHTRRTVSTGARALALAGVLALVGAACGTDDPETAPEPTPAAPAAVDAAADVASPGADDGAGDEIEAAPEAGDVALTATVDFENAGGSWEVADGAGLLGCDGGSFSEDGFAAGVERTLSCDDGARSGTIVVRFSPEMVDPDAEIPEFTSEWTVHTATGDFAGLRGGGDWAGTLTEEGSASDETFSGSIEFGDPAEDIAQQETDATDVADGVLDEAFLVSVVDGLDVPDDAEGTVTVAVIDATGDAISAADGNALDGAAPGTADPVRVGSISKVFTSLATLSLVADGAIALDDPATTHISRAQVPEGVTVGDLLGHTSGIPEYVATDGFFESVADDRLRRWTPEEIVALVDGMDLEFAPGEDFGYSNTNFALLGILIEEVTGQPAHEVIRDRVIDVVGMPSTYLAGAEDGPEPVGAFGALPGQELEPTSDFDYTSIATSAWVSGAMVSSGDDLHALFTALVAGEIIPSALVDEMTTTDEWYGLGIEMWDTDASLIGHGGSIAGYEALVFHEPATGRTAYWLSTSNELHWGPIVEDVVFQMAPELESADED